MREVTLFRALALSDSWFTSTIRERMSNGDEPNPMAEVFQRGMTWFAVVRWPDKWLLLRLLMNPTLPETKRGKKVVARVAPWAEWSE